jgi:zinc protease
METIRTAPVEALRRFYQDWYRPDLMAVIAVGDFDVDAVEEKIQAHFSDLPVPDAPRPRAAFEVPEHAEPRYLVLSDPEQSYTMLEVLIKRPANPSRTVADFRDDLITSLFYQMFNQRLNQLRLQEEPPFVYAGAGDGEFIRPLEVTNYYAQVQDVGIINGLTALVTEIERVQQHGFTESELERASKIILRSLEQAYKERNNQYSIDFVYGLQQQFLVGTVDVPIETRYQLAQQLLPAITLAEVNRLVAEMVAEENRVVFAIAPERTDLVLPTEDELAA